MRISPLSLSVVTMYARGERNEKSQIRSGAWFSCMYYTYTVRVDINKINKTKKE